MCIICDKPMGVDMPSDDEIKYMFEHNPHGAGFAIQGWYEHIYYNPKTQKEEAKRRFEVHYQKGFMTIDDLLEALGPKEKLKDRRVVIHCRIKTSGKTDKATTHPFPLSSCYGDLKKEEGEGAVLFHNGVFSGLGGIIDKNSSDTQDYVSGVACRHLAIPNHISSMGKVIAKKIAGDCRVLILYPNPNHPDFRLGTWHEHNGCQYSNMGYKHPYTPTKYSNSSTASRDYDPYTYSYGGYNDDEYDEEYYEQMMFAIEKEDEALNKAQLEKYMKKDSCHQYDRFGMNTADGAWPGPLEHWIQFKTKYRLDTIKNSAVKTGVTKSGQKLYYFRYDPTKAWIIDEDKKEMYDTDGYKLILQKQDIEQEELEELWNENMKYFNDHADMAEFMEEGTKTGANTCVIEGETWYFDWVERTAYTEIGLNFVFKTGEIGHVKRSLEKYGYNLYGNEQQELRKEHSENNATTAGKSATETIR